MGKAKRRKQESGRREDLRARVEQRESRGKPTRSGPIFKIPATGYTGEWESRTQMLVYLLFFVGVVVIGCGLALGSVEVERGWHVSSWVGSCVSFFGFVIAGLGFWELVAWRDRRAGW